MGYLQESAATKVFKTHKLQDICCTIKERQDQCWLACTYLHFFFGILAVKDGAIVCSS